MRLAPLGGKGRARCSPIIWDSTTVEKKPSLIKRAKTQLKRDGKKSTEQRKSGGSVLMSTKIDF